MTERSVTARGGLRLRESPRDGDVIRVLELGENVTVLGEETWLRVRAGADEGFVLADYTAPTSFASAVGRPSAAAPADGIVTFIDDNFRGDKPVRIHADFEPALRQAGVIAKRLRLQVWVTSSLREPRAPVGGAIVDPARLSNHNVGHAIDMNPISNGRLYTSRDMKPDGLSALPSEVRDFIAAVSQPPFRWGGNFSDPDPVHIDDGLNVLQPDAYRAKVRRIWG